jgi:hypothetical protein
MTAINYDLGKVRHKKVQIKTEKGRWIPVMLRQEVSRKSSLDRRRLLSEGAQMDYISSVKLNVY